MVLYYINNMFIDNYLKHIMLFIKLNSYFCYGITEFPIYQSPYF